MTEPDIAFEVLDGRRAAELATGFLAMHAEVYEEPPYRWVDNQHERFARRFAVLCRQPGFVLAEARHGEYLVGFGCGMPLRPSTDWWRDLTTPLSSEVTAEYPGRTFAVADLLVRAAWRRQRIGETLHDLLVSDREEERSTALVLPAAVPAQSACATWGWRKVARKQDPLAGSPVFDVFVRYGYRDRGS
ncbi:MAG TPA: GNAT family N-acetyltransferase [Streptosporangiaceae bacterium]|nr:GNAT family N-acetyltransferase [Streptosporangiaceae bacterium]